MSLENKDDIDEVEPVIEELNISETWDTESQVELVIQRLKKLKLYSPSLLFRGFDGNKIQVVRKHGIDTPKKETSYFSTEKELHDHAWVDGRKSAISYALEFDVPGIAIYDSALLTHNGREAGLKRVLLNYEYSPKEGAKYKEALIAIFIFK